MNITEKMLRWPTVSVMTPIDQAMLTASTISMRMGLPTRPKASPITMRVRAKASTVAIPLSWNAADISSLESAGPPVTPAWTVGKLGRSLAMAPRTASIDFWSPTKLPLSPLGDSTRMKSRLLSSERK